MSELHSADDRFKSLLTAELERRETAERLYAQTVEELKKLKQEHRALVNPTCTRTHMHTSERMSKNEHKYPKGWRMTRIRCPYFIQKHRVVKKSEFYWDDTEREFVPL